MEVSRSSGALGHGLIGGAAGCYRPRAGRRSATMSRSALSKLYLTGGLFVSLALAAGAMAQPASPPDFFVGDVGWVHTLNATFPPVQGSPSPVMQAPGHPFLGATS